MATVNKCDLCNEEAVDTVELKSKNTTPVTCDVCEEHFVLYKKIKQMFIGQLKDEGLKSEVESVSLEVG